MAKSPELIDKCDLWMKDDDHWLMRIADIKVSAKQIKEPFQTSTVT